MYEYIQRLVDTILYWSALFLVKNNLTVNISLQNEQNYILILNVKFK